MTVIEGEFCLKTSTCCTQIRSAFRSSRSSGVRLWVVITPQTLQ